MSAVLPPLRDEIAFLGLGSNVGDRLDFLQRAVDLLDADHKTCVDQVSTVYETEPVGGPAQGPFLNIAVRVRTRRSPWRLLRLCHQVEQRLGRVRQRSGESPIKQGSGESPTKQGSGDSPIKQGSGESPIKAERWGPRTIDVDILLWQGRVVATRSLQIPHPRLAERAFALVPLIEVAPGAALPDGTSLATLLARLAPIDGVTAIGTQVRSPR